MRHEVSYRLTKNPDTLGHLTLSAMLWAQREFSERTAQVERAAQVIGVVVDVPFDEQLPSKF